MFNRPADIDIKLVISDFDGVFTDGSIFIFDDFKTARKVSFKDIMGISQALKNDFQVVLISGEKSSTIDYLLKKFDKLKAYQNIRNKIEILKQIIDENNVNKEQVIYIGDDVNDIECLNYVGCAVTVPNANIKVRELDIVSVTSSCGGDGAFREVVDALLRA